MFFEISGNRDIVEKKLDEINLDNFIFGYISNTELEGVSQKFGFEQSTVEACKTASPYFRTDVDVYDTYTFTELKIVSGDGEEDCVALYLMKNFMLVVDILDRDNSTRDTFLQSLKKYPNDKIKPEKIVCVFIEALLSGDSHMIEKLQNEITRLEETVISNSVDRDFNSVLLNLKKRLLKLQNYYEQLLDIAETLEENDNDIFEEDNLIYISNLSNKVTRLKGSVDSLQNSADHLQDAYSSLLDQKLNQTMKFFTVITSIFFPLTIIVGWYGMNFDNMPELKWRFGYLYVFILSAVMVIILSLIGKKKKWY